MLRAPRYERAIQASAYATERDPSLFPIATPWSSSQLEKIVAEDIFGPDGIRSNNRRSALAIPAVKRGRGLIVTSVSRMPLRAMRRDEILPEQPTWLYSTRRTSPRSRIVWTLDDHMFYGWSCWRRWNSASTGFPIDVDRVNFGDWHITPDNKVMVCGVEMRDDEVILIPSYQEGILVDSKDALSDIKRLYEIVRDRLNNPVAMTELHQVSGKPLAKTERDEMLDHWRTARKLPGGTVGYTSPEIDLRTHGADGDATLLIEARNAAAVDVARIIGVSAGMVDATTPKASLNYETTTGRNAEFIDLDLEAYMGPIEDRLSLDDIVPAGTRIAFDRGAATAPAMPATGPTLED